ncbi:MAG: HAMP domain-containing histidine kinase [Nitrosarchaeum sp.]|nr:HAMP domain-containing histidine kinase [Nitrosarchaeum sp.]
MKIINKTYILISILILVAIINLTLLYQAAQLDNSQSYTIISIGDLKAQIELISGLAISVASGDIEEKEKLDYSIKNTEQVLSTLKDGGMINNLTIERVPSTLSVEFNKILASWKDYKEKIIDVENTSVFDKDATVAMNYVLQKNTELVLVTNEVSKELSGLDRDYNRHKEIANELKSSAQEIGKLTLVISIGEEESAQEELKNERIKFNTGLENLLGLSNSEKLAKIPRENSEGLRKLDPLWESIQPKIEIIEERALLSTKFIQVRNEMNSMKNTLYSDIDDLLYLLNYEITEESKKGQTVIQVLLAIDIIIFLMVLYVVRQSLLPLKLITNALSEIKEGAYGKKIDYKKNDEAGELVQTFNIMSNTIKEKDEQTKRTDIAKDEFLAMITHELKTPLVPIQGYADILLSEHLGKLNEKQIERINIIKDSSENLLSIISDLLDAQKLELGQLRMRLENKNIKTTIEDAIKTFLPQLQKEGIKITSNIQDVIIEHDPSRINQVISNLIKNSINAVKNTNGKIEITTQDSPQELKIHVKDNGVGIPADKQKGLFKKFYQVDATLTREKGGSGLGLAICKGIIENHKGTITLTSSPNHETIFTISLPKKELKKSPIGIT